MNKETFLNAKKVVKQYEKQVNKSLISNRICICCKTKEITPEKGSALDVGNISPTEQETGMWNGGTVEKVSFGYGSRHDSRIFYMAICDDCIDELEKLNLVTDFHKLKKDMQNKMEETQKS